MDNVVYQTEKEGHHFYIVERYFPDRKWLCGYVTVSKRELQNARKSFASFIGYGYEVGIGLDEPMIGVDTADPADDWMTTKDVVKQLEKILLMLNR